MTKKEKGLLFRQCMTKLEQKYSDVTIAKETDPLEQLIWSIIHHETPLPKAEKALQLFKDEFVDWNEVRVSAVSEIAGVLQDAGMDDGRARLIKAVLGDLFLKKNQLSLDFLKKYQEKQAYDFLKRIEGLPDAVIDEVMLISLHHTCFPMNASVTRVCDRLGIVGGGDGGSARDFMAAIVPKTLMPMGYMLFNAHGERTCKPKTPDCGVCALTACCTYFGEKSGPKRPAAGAKGAKPGRKGKTRPSPTKKKTGKAPSS